jgi:hypothetical protein
MKPADSHHDEDPPDVPVFRTWRGVYGFVLFFGIACILLLALFSRVFS